MHGNPTFRLIIVAVAYLLAGVAVWRVTMPAEARPLDAPAPAPLVTAPAAVQPVRVQLTFASPPTVFELCHLDRTLIGGTAVMDQLADVDSFDLEIPIPAEGIDLVLRAAWPPETGETAVRLRVWVAGRPAVDRTFWARGELADVVTVR